MIWSVASVCTAGCRAPRNLIHCDSPTPGSRMCVSKFRNKLRKFSRCCCRGVRGLLGCGSSANLTCGPAVVGPSIGETGDKGLSPVERSLSSVGETGQSDSNLFAVAGGDGDGES